MAFCGFFLLLVGAYITGAIPSGYIIARLCGIPDVRLFGSGNIGATNVARVLGLSFFFIVLFIDAFKAYWYVHCIVEIKNISFFSFFIIFSLLLGNGYSLFLHFSGGKGVGTAVGIFAALSSTMALLFTIIWASIFLLTGTPSIASLIALCLLSFTGYIYWYEKSSIIIMITIWCLWRHKKNIVELYKRWLHCSPLW